MKKIENLIQEIRIELESKYPFLVHWDVSFDNANRRAGVCKLSNKQISISKKHILNNSIEVVKDTLLHEFSHAIAFELYRHKGHGKIWKNIACELGATPRATGIFNLPQAPWLLVHACPKEELILPIAQRYRRNSKIKNYFLNGRPETKGQLFFIELSEFQAYQSGLKSQSQLSLIQ